MATANDLKYGMTLSLDGQPPNAAEFQLPGTGEKANGAARAGQYPGRA